jgi:hypothetical protein
MATTTYSTKLRLAIPTTGELADTWGNLINTGLTALVDDAIAGIATVAHPDTASYTLTANNAASDEARCAVLKITGALTAARNVVCPTQPKLYIMENATTGGFAVTLKTAAGTGISVANGESALLRCDGTNVVYWTPTTGTGSAVRSVSPTLTGPAFVGDTANTFNTNGLTLNQGATTNENLSLKASTVAHGITSSAETDTYGTFRMNSSTLGGLACFSYSNYSSSYGVNAVFGVDSTGKTAGADVPISVGIAKKNGTAGNGASVATQNIFAIAEGVSWGNRFIFDNAATMTMLSDSYTDVIGNGEATLLSATAVPAGGTAGKGYKFSNTSNFGVFFGSGVPTLSAAKGSLYLRSDGTTTNDRMYVNTNGSTTWTAVTTAA